MRVSSPEQSDATRTGAAARTGSRCTWRRSTSQTTGAYVWCVCVHIYMCMYIYVYVYIYICMYMCMRVYIIYIYMDVCIMCCVCMCNVTYVGMKLPSRNLTATVSPPSKRYEGNIDKKTGQRSKQTRCSTRWCYVCVCVRIVPRSD